MIMANKDITITDEDADRSIKSLSAGQVVPSNEFLKSYSVGQINDNLVSQKKSSYLLSKSLIKLLKTIIKNPMRPSSEYPKLAKISPNTFQKIRPILIDKGFIREHKLESGGRGRSTMLLEPLESAKKVIADNVNYKGSF
jgi:hypothetical protein